MMAQKPVGKFIDNALRREARVQTHRAIGKLIPRREKVTDNPLANFVGNAIEREVRYQTHKTIHKTFTKR